MNFYAKNHLHNLLDIFGMKIQMRHFLGDFQTLWDRRHLGLVGKIDPFSIMYSKSHFVAWVMSKWVLRPFSQKLHSFHVGKLLSPSTATYPGVSTTIPSSMFSLTKKSPQVLLSWPSGEVSSHNHNTDGH